MPDDPDFPLTDEEGLAPSEAPPAWESETAAARLARLAAKARNLPPVPGVYLMKDASGVVLYVGKASRLPDRVGSYFVPSADLGPKKQPMLALVHDFDYLPFSGEWEALLAENRLIKDIQPRYNENLRDDKTYPYLAITMREDFPRVFVTRSPADPELRGAKILGPFSSAGALREAVALLQRVFRFRTCHLDIVDGDPKNAHFRPCLLYNINQCTAPCAAKIGRDAYREDIDRFARFLTSKRAPMLRQMRREMEEAAANLEFERAATLRDEIRAIEKLGERGSAGEGWQPETESFYVDPERGLRSLQRTLGLDEPIRCIEAIDIAHLAGGQTVGSKVCFVDGRPFKNEYRRYRIKSAQNDDYAAIREVVSRRYREAGAGQELYPDVILIDGGLGQLHAALEAFEQLDVKPPLVISLAKKEELIYVQDRPRGAGRLATEETQMNTDGEGEGGEPAGDREGGDGGRGGPIRLGRDNPGLKLCQFIRDEAHRFAQHYHHILRRKRVLEED